MNKIYNFLFIVFLLYISSWFLPVLQDQSGFNGAALSLNRLYKGLSFPFHPEIYSSINILYALVDVFKGLPNLLFITICVLLFKRPNIAFYFAPACVLSMLVWWQMQVQIGYYIWLSSGFLLALLSFYPFLHLNAHVSNTSIMLRMLISILLPLALFLFRFILQDSDFKALMF